MSSSFFDHGYLAGVPWVPRLFPGPWSMFCSTPPEGVRTGYGIPRVPSNNPEANNIQNTKTIPPTQNGLIFIWRRRFHMRTMKTAPTMAIINQCEVKNAMIDDRIYTTHCQIYTTIHQNKNPSIIIVKTIFIAFDNFLLDQINPKSKSPIMNFITPGSVAVIPLIHPVPYELVRAIKIIAATTNPIAHLAELLIGVLGAVTPVLSLTSGIQNMDARAIINAITNAAIGSNPNVASSAYTSIQRKDTTAAALTLCWWWSSFASA